MQGLAVTSRDLNRGQNDFSGRDSMYGQSMKYRQVKRLAFEDYQAGRF